MDGKIQLQSIPPKFVCPKNGTTYTLLGAVEYRGKAAVSRSSTSI